MLKFTTPTHLPPTATAADLVAELTVDGETAMALLDTDGRLTIETVPEYPAPHRRWGVALERTAYAVLMLRERETLPALLNLGFVQI